MDSGWIVVIVDDDSDVFQVTRLVLRRMKVLGHPIRLVHCASATAAREFLTKERGIAVLVSDVVMEEDDAGLQLVKWARAQAHLANMRIVIRTGQPGMAPEQEVLQGLDINDYWRKQDLSSQRMKTLLTGLIRSYRDLEERTNEHDQAQEELAEKRARLEQLAAAESLFRAVSESVSAGTILLQDRAILFANTTAEGLLGIAGLRGADSLPEPLNHVPLPAVGELVLEGPDGKRWIAFRTRPVLHEGIAGQLVTLTDQTEWKKAEDQRRKAESDLLRTQHLEQIGLLASGVAHDLNNLMTIILGTGEYLSELTEDEAIRAGLEDISEASKAATSLAQQMMLYGSGGGAVKKKQDFREVVETALGIWTGEAKRTSVTVDYRSETTGALPVQIATSQGQQLIGNLMSNALRAMPGGGVVRIWLSRMNLSAEELGQASFGGDREPGEFAMLSFSDEGEGIPEDALHRIFEPFYTTHKAGRGLGLAVITSIAEHLRAPIFLSSTVGKGTTFRFAIPLLEVTTSIEMSRAVAPGDSPLRILVLEDVALVRRQITRLLSRHGHSVVDVATLDEALNEMRERFDIAVIDFMLEETTGDIAIRKLREHQPTMPAILCSGYIDPERLDRTKEFSEVIHKPFSAAALLSAVERHSRMAERGQ